MAVTEAVLIVPVVVLPLPPDDVNGKVEEEGAVEDAPCDHAIEMNCWRMRNKEKSRCEKNIVLVLKGEVQTCKKKRPQLTVTNKGHLYGYLTVTHSLIQYCYI